MPSTTPSSRGRPQRYSDLAITTVLVIKRVFRLTLRAAQGFIDSIFTLMNVPLRCPDYSCVSRRAKSVNVSFKTPTRGEIAHLVIDSTGLKVFGEGEWKVKKHGQERRRIWRKLHLAVDSNTHEIICADLSLNNVTDSEAFPGLIRQTHRKIRAASADGAYDTRLCHDGVSLDIENYCTLRLFFDLSTLAGLSRRNLPEAGIRLLFQI